MSDFEHSNCYYHLSEYEVKFDFEWPLDKKEQADLSNKLNA